MQHVIIVGLMAEDMKAVLKGNPRAIPGYGSTYDAAVGNLVTLNPQIFGIVVQQSEPDGPEAAQ